MIKNVKILGVPFSKLTLKETMTLIDSKVSTPDDKLFHIITANPEIAMQIVEDPEFKEISEDAGIITPDGIGIIYASKFNRDPIAERVTGVEILEEMLVLGNQKNLSFYFFGAKEETNALAVENIKKDYPNVKIAGRRNGYFSESDEANIVKDISEANPDILILALGSPKAHKWIYKYKKQLNAKVAMGVGGGLDVLSGNVKRAPQWVQTLHCEWLYRRILEPSRKERQKVLFVFARLAIKEAFFSKRK